MKEIIKQQNHIIKIGHTVKYHSEGSHYDGMIGIVTNLIDDLVYADWGVPYSANGTAGLFSVSLVIGDWDE